MVPHDEPHQGGAPKEALRHISHACRWCGMAVRTGELACLACGAPVDIKEAVTASGWAELPGIKDMAVLQFGDSHCQIEGTYAPVADVSLAGGDSVYFAHHVLLWKDDSITVTARRMADTWSQTFAGMPLVMLEATGPGHVAFSKDQPGEIIALPLNEGQAVHVREHIFMVASSQVSYDWFNPHIWYSTKDGGDQLFHWPLGQFMDRFYAQDAPGLVLLHGAGNVFVRTLAAGDTILVKPTGLLFSDVTVQMQLHIEQPEGGAPSFGWIGQRQIWLRLVGPGRVAIQSAFKHMEDNGRKVLRSSPATRQEW